MKESSFLLQQDLNFQFKSQKIFINILDQIIKHVYLIPSLTTVYIKEATIKTVGFGRLRLSLEIQVPPTFSYFSNSGLSGAALEERPSVQALFEKFARNSQKI